MLQLTVNVLAHCSKCVSVVAARGVRLLLYGVRINADAVALSRYCLLVLGII